MKTELKNYGIVLRNCEENWSWPNIDSPQFERAIDELKSGTITKEQVSMIISAISALNHITNPVYTFKSIEKQLRQIRNARYKLR